MKTEAEIADTVMVEPNPREKDRTEQTGDSCFQVAPCPSHGKHIALLVGDEEEDHFANRQWQNEVDTAATTVPHDNFGIPAVIFIGSITEVPDDESLELPFRVPVRRPLCIPKQPRSLLTRWRNSVWRSKTSEKSTLPQTNALASV